MAYNYQIKSKKIHKLLATLSEHMDNEFDYLQHIEDYFEELIDSVPEARSWIEKKLNSEIKKF